MVPCRILLVLGIVLIACHAPVRGQTLPSPDEITAAIHQLGADDYTVRQKATDFLWRAGTAAEPALKEALSNPDGEISSRAHEILEKFKYGILPGTPQKVIDLVREYRAAPKEKKRALVYELTQLGRPADEVLRRIAASEESADIRNMILDTMASGAGGRAAAALAEGKPAAAESILIDAMRFSYDSVRRDYAAYALLTGKLDTVIADLEKDPRTLRYGGDTQINLRLLAFCYRTKGDLPAALATAQRLNDDALTAELQFEAGAWPQVAGHLTPPAGAADEQIIGAALSQVSLAQVAGDDKAAVAALTKLKALNPPAHALAQALLTSGHVAEGLDQYQAHLDDNAVGVYQLLEQHGDIAGALALAEKAIKDGNNQARDLALEVIGTWRGLGDDARARELFAQFKKQEAANADPRVAAGLILAARQIGLADEAYALAAARCKQAEETNAEAQGGLFNVETFLTALGPAQAERAIYWYKLLRKMGRTPAQALSAIRGLAERTLPDKDLRELVEQATLMVGDVEAGQEPSDEDKAQRAAYISDTLYRLGKPELTQTLLEKLAARSGAADPLLRLGDIAADQNNPSAAARYYQQAFDKDKAQPALLYLSGAALLRAGKTPEGRATEDRANVMMLAEDADRAIAADALTARGFGADAAAQNALIVRTGDFHSPAMKEAWAGLQTRYADAGNYAAALAMAERAVADALTAQGGPVPMPEALLALPIPLYQSRAQQALSQGQGAAAEKAMAAAAALIPADLTVGLAVIPQLDRGGQKDQADKVFDTLWSQLQAQLKDHPNCPIALNNLAWLCAKTQRHKAEAVVWAQKVVALRPQESQYLDTLAEAQFANGQAKEALETERQALHLDPDEGFYREQIERFGAQK